MAGVVIFFILALAVAATIMMGVRIVPQGFEYVVQRLGKYHVTLKPGLNFIIPYIDTVSYRISTKDIKARLREIISSDVVDWGISVKSVEIQDIKPSASMQHAMEQQASAERTKRAAILEAEGRKAAVILDAEGKLEAAKKEAEAQVTLADASAKAIGSIAAAVGDKELPAMFLLGDRYVGAMQKLATSQNTKTYVLPADLLEAVKGILHK